MILIRMYIGSNIKILMLHGLFVVLRARTVGAKWVGSVAKRKLDSYYFVGRHLLVRYGPEYESVEDTRFKLSARRETVERLLMSK